MKIFLTPQPPEGAGIKSITSLLFALLALAYAIVLWHQLSPYWFHPHWTTDDSLQQVFPFYEAIYPGRFSGDVIYELMKGYLAPFHYWLGYGITLLTHDPLMMAHWMTLIQLLLASVFLFVTVRNGAGAIAPAFFSVLWFLHTRPVIQRMTGGLPRGWAAPVLCAFTYFFLTNNLWGIHLTFLWGCLTHPPATLVAMIAYGLYLSLRFVRAPRNQELRRGVLILIAASPLYFLITYAVIHRPAEIGQMVSYDQAASLPEFSYPNGRFPFVPLQSVGYEFRHYAYQPFFHRLYDPGKLARELFPYCIWVVLAALLAYNLRRNTTRETATKLLCFLLGATAVYFASRIFAFKLYVPNRHLQFPFSIFLITTFSILLWNTAKSDLSKLLTLLICGVVVTLGSGSGLYGSANFNYSLTKRGDAFAWIRDHTPVDALIAGHPTHIDPTQLYAARKAFATTETAHPFYPGYFAEIKRRLEISLRAHYATSIEEFLALLLPEKIDYFVFSRRRFYPEVLQQERYFAPLDGLIKELTSRPRESYLFLRFSKGGDLEQQPYIVFQDSESIVIDIRLLAPQMPLAAAKDLKFKGNVSSTA